MIAANKELVARFVRDYQVGDDRRVLIESVSPGMVNHTPVVPGLRGPAEIEAIQALFCTAFPDLDVEIVDQLAEGDRVMTHKVFTGTHRGEFMGIPATGRPVRFAVMDVVRIADGRIVEHWAVADQLGLLRQLGVAT